MIISVDAVCIGNDNNAGKLQTVSCTVRLSGSFVKLSLW